MEKIGESAEARMARGLAPIKREYIRKALPRFAGDVKAQQAEQKRDNGSSKVASEKKCRRKMKKVINTTASIGHINKPILMRSIRAKDRRSILMPLKGRGWLLLGLLSSEHHLFHW